MQQSQGIFFFFSILCLLLKSQYLNLFPSFCGIGLTLEQKRKAHHQHNFLSSSYLSGIKESFMANSGEQADKIGWHNQPYKTEVPNQRREKEK